MPKYQVQAPDGSTYEYDVPDGTPENEVIAHAQSQFQAAPPKNEAAPGYTQVADPETGKSRLRVDITPEDDRPTSFTEGLAKGVAKPFYNLARLAETGAEKLGIADELRSFGEFINPGATPQGGISAEEEAFNARLEGGETRPSGVGEFAGNVAATLPTAMIPGGVLAQGAVAGGLLTNQRDAGGVAQDMGIGAAGGFVGDRVMRGAAAVISPRVNAGVQRLLGEGVPLTPGQIVGQGGVVGRSAKRIEDSLSNFPVVGTAIRGARARADEALNRAATNRALRPIGEALPDDVPVGHEAVAHAGDRLRAAYQDVLPRLSGRLDRTFATRIQTIRTGARLPPEYDAVLDQAQQEVGNAFTRAGPNGTYNGRTLRAASERLERLAAGWRANPNDPYLREVGGIAEQMRQQLHALARRQNPQQAARLRNIDRGYASLVRVERAAAGTDDGLFTPRGYKTATRQSDRSVRKRQSARGQALDQDLSSAAASVMPSTVGEGGSNAVNSLAMMGGLGAGALGGVPAAAATIGGLGAGSLMYTRPGQRVMQNALAGRQGAPNRYLAEALRLTAPVGGNLATNALLQGPQ